MNCLIAKEYKKILDKSEREENAFLITQYRQVAYPEYGRKDLHDEEARL